MAIWSPSQPLCAGLCQAAGCGPGGCQASPMGGSVSVYRKCRTRPGRLRKGKQPPSSGGAGAQGGVPLFHPKDEVFLLFWKDKANFTSSPTSSMPLDSERTAPKFLRGHSSFSPTVHPPVPLVLGLAFLFCLEGSKAGSALCSPST